MGGNVDNIFFERSQLKYCGKDVIIGKTVRIRKPEEVSIGGGTIIDDFTYISCGMTVGKHCHIASNVSISGSKAHLHIGDYSTISNHCSIHCVSSDYRKISLDLPSVPEEERFGGEFGDIHIGNNVVVGAHSTILPNVEIQDYVAFGAYSLIKDRDYIKGYLYVGIPAKMVCKREEI